jgi:glyoxalase/bleomycin resistance protein/dioxygenase superfamily protein
MDMLRPKALDHVGLKVTDMEKSLHFYQTLGLELLRTSDPKDKGPVERRNGTSVFVYDPDGVHVELRVESARAAE